MAGRAGQVAGVVVGVLAVVLATGGCTGSPTAPAPVAVVALGDSVSVADSPDFDGGAFGRRSWAARADGEPIDLRGGWAHDGATTGDLVQYSAAMTADVLVIMAGTNDVLARTTQQTSERNLAVLAERSDVDVVVLCSIVPSTRMSAENDAYNDRLEVLAREEGWDFVDCAAPVREPDGSWVPGTTTDGIHPSARGAALIGDAVREHLLALRSSGRVPG